MPRWVDRMEFFVQRKAFSIDGTGRSYMEERKGFLDVILLRSNQSVGRVEDHTVGVWEPHELADAYRFFFTYVDDDDRLPDVIVLHLHRNVGPALGMN